MLLSLVGATGKLKTLLARLTSTRAGNLDYLDVSVASRAASATALSTAQWTNALATELDGLAPAIAAIPTSVINNIQYGSASFTAGDSSKTATVTAVVVAKSVLIPLGVSTIGSTLADTLFRMTLTNTTTVTITRADNNDNATVAFVLVEFK